MISLNTDAYADRLAQLTMCILLCCWLVCTLWSIFKGLGRSDSEPEALIDWWVLECRLCRAWTNLRAGLKAFWNPHDPSSCWYSLDRGPQNKDRVLYRSLWSNTLGCDIHFGWGDEKQIFLTKMETLKICQKRKQLDSAYNDLVYLVHRSPKQRRWALCDWYHQYHMLMHWEGHMVSPECCIQRAESVISPYPDNTWLSNNITPQACIYCNCKWP